MTVARALLTGLTLLAAAGGARAQSAGKDRDTGLGKSGAPDRLRRLCIVTKIADGDSFTCADKTKIRLLLIDAPERDQKPFGKAARQQLTELLPLGDTVWLESDVRPYDRYRRLLAYVYLADGRMVNEEMARAGYVVVLSYPPNVRHLERIRKAVRQARASKRGLWSTSAFACSPRDHRRRRC
jgi:micrococcal nuclease